MTWLKQTLAVLGTMAVVMALAAVVFPARATALVATLVRDVDNPARDTFQAIFQTSCSVSGNTVSCSGLTLPTTNGSGAAISMVVIEYVATACESGSTGILTNYSDAQIFSILGNSSISIPTTTSTSGYFMQLQLAPGVFTQQTRFYAAPGSTLVMAGAASTCTLTISGYMVTP
jgi:hypothetical protein